MATISLRKFHLPKTNTNNDASNFCHRVFTYFLAILMITSHATSAMVVSRDIDGDHFTNPGLVVKQGCDIYSATCVENLYGSCTECKCRSGNETYRLDTNLCVPRQDLDSFSGCLYKGLKDHRTGLLDIKLTTLDLTKRNSKNIHALLKMPRRVTVTCHITNTSGFLNQRGAWTPLPRLPGVFRLDVRRDVTASVRRYLNLNWEGVSDLTGYLIKLDMACKADNGIDSETDCFLFKTTGKHDVDVKTEKPTTQITTTIPTKTTTAAFAPTTTNTEPQTTTSAPTTMAATTTDTPPPLRKHYTYTVPRNIIIGVSVGVALVILIIIVLAVFCVRARVKKLQKRPSSSVSVEAPKVHFTAQSRFSLIREQSTAQSELEPAAAGDYACLQDNRESYDPYCSLRKDDADLNVIDQVLKEAISIESVQPSSEPRYSYRLSGNEMVIETVPARSTDTPNYHVLESDDPDYEEVESSDEEEGGCSMVRRLPVKPPLPEREYHILESPTGEFDEPSKC